MPQTLGRDRLLFTTLIALALLAAFVGFAPSYYLKVWFDRPPLQTLVHVHGLLFTAWLLVLLTQSVLIRRRRHAMHAQIGKWAVTIAALMVITGFMVVLSKPRLTEASRAFIFTPLVSLVLFPLFLATAIRLRDDPAAHKRWMLLATLLLMGAPMTRLLLMAGVKPGPYTHHVVGYLLLLLPLVANDLWRSGRLHPATQWGGLILLLRHPLHELVAFSPGWQRIAAVIAG